MSQTLQMIYAWNRPYLPTGGTEKVYLLIEFEGKSEQEMDRIPINLSLVLDRSGSMSGEPIEFSKKACQFVVGQMGPKDTLSMVAFDDEIATVFEPEPVLYKDLMKKKIESIQPGGSTNLSGGLIQGAGYTLKGKMEGMVNRVILLSDGHANVGITDPHKLSSIAKEYQTMGLGITTMGVGDGFDEELMEAIADQGGGNFYYIEKPDDIPGIFAKELEGLLSVVSQNVYLKIKPIPLVEITNLYGYQGRQDHGERFVHLGDIYNHEIKSILIELSVFPHSNGKHPVLDLEWGYVDVTQGIQEVSLKTTVTADFTNQIDLLGQQPDPKVEKQVLLTQSALMIDAAMHDLDDGDIEAGKMKLQVQAKKMLEMAKLTKDSDLKMESELLFSQLDNFHYSEKTRKTLHEQKYRNMKRKKR